MNTVYIYIVSFYIGNRKNAWGLEYDWVRLVPVIPKHTYVAIRLNAVVTLFRSNQTINMDSSKQGNDYRPKYLFNYSRMQVTFPYKYLRDLKDG